MHRSFRTAIAAAAALSLIALAGCASDPEPDTVDREPIAVDAAPSPSVQPTPGGEVTDADTVATAEQVYRDFVAATAEPGADLNVCQGSDYITADSFPDMVPTFIIEGTPVEVATWDEPGLYRVRGEIEDADGVTSYSYSQMLVKIGEDGTGCVWNAAGYGWR